MFPRSRPLCPNCETATKLAWITRGPLGFDIRIFECPACGDVHQQAVDMVDPMKCMRTTGWLQGQLQAPI
jgi:hypothetical protein